MRSTLKQFVRDWSAKVLIISFFFKANYDNFVPQGKEERDMCYTPIKEEFKKYFPNPVNPTNNSLIKVLFPGKLKYYEYFFLFLINQELVLED